MSSQPTLKKDLLAERERWRRSGNWNCFWSSPENPHGLRLTPEISPGLLRVSMRIESHHTSFPGIAHGGIVYAVIDGLMGWYILAHEGRAGVTVEMVTCYKGALRLGERYVFEVSASDRDPGSAAHRILTGRAYLERDPDKRPLLEMTGKFFLPDRATAESAMGMVLDDTSREFFPEAPVKD